MSRDSKFLARLLRHEPSLIGLRLDSGDWARIDELLRRLKKAGRAMTYEQLETIVRDNEKRRFTICGDKIRAAQGHSIEVDLGLAERAPPAHLYLGTAVRNLDQIFAKGLLPGRRRQVHLSEGPDVALLTGQRHGKPIVLRVDSAAMHSAGHRFSRADNGVWLTDQVPAIYFGFDVA